MTRSILAVATVAVFASCGHEPLAPGGELSATPDFGIAATTTTVTYDFDDLAHDCSGDAFPSEYQGLTFVDPPHFGICGGRSPIPPGDMVIIPTTQRRQTIVLPGQAISVQAQGMWFNEWWDSGVHPPAIEARDSDGNHLGTMTWSRFPTYQFPTGYRFYLETKGINAPDIHSLTVVADNREFMIAYISATYVDPVQRGQCMKGGWESFGFDNLGLCVRFVETGKDSR